MEPAGRKVDWHALRRHEVLAEAGSDATSGLSRREAARRLERIGPNALPEPRRPRFASLFLRQFQSPLIYLLLAASAAALVSGKGGDAVVILLVVFLNALIGSIQEGRAERSLESLRRMASVKARVLRDGLEHVVEARALVPGDMLVLAAGDAVAADARLLDGAALEVAEAALTGESAPIAKQAAALAFDTPLPDRSNMVFAGTHVTSGRARGVVVATGRGTEVGRIAALAEGAREPKTPLERRIAQLGRSLVVASGALFVAVNALGAWRGLAAGEIAMVAVSQVVGLIPEGLPAAMTIALAVGVQRMARRGAIVRRLAAVEALGSTTVICTDKTGTLTRNEMTVSALWLPSGREIAITGGGYAPVGTLVEAGRELAAEPDPELEALLVAAVLCNDGQLLAPDESEPAWRGVGDPTEVAILAAALKAGLPLGAVRERFPRRAELPFDPAVKMMATQHDDAGRARVFVKGAPEVVTELCGFAGRGGEAHPLDRAALAAARAAADRLADRALRVLAVAVVDDSIDGALGFRAFEGRAVLLGLIGQLDPARPEVGPALSACRAAGIRTVMVTGDHKTTAFAIARALGIAAQGDDVLDGRDLERLGDPELDARLPRASVFARVHPAQKLRIVEAFQRAREVVAMTGDGVNDAPALAHADVGVAMGRTGTEVAKQAARVVVVDDNFATIVAAVEEGRLVYRNLKKVIFYLLSTSIPAVVVLLAALLLGYPPPLAALQILWINLVTEGTVTVNLIMEPAEGDEMRQPPIAPGEPLLGRPALWRMAVIVPVIIAAILGWFMTRLAEGVPLPIARSETFTLLAVCAWFNVLNCRSERRSALGLGLLRNPWLLGGLLLGNAMQLAVIYWGPLRELFHAEPIQVREFVWIGLVGSCVLWAEELRKLAQRSRPRRAT